MAEFIDRVEDIEISRTSRGVTRRGFASMLILAYHALYADRVRGYSDLSELTADGFAPDHPAYVQAAAAWAQEPSLPLIKIGRRALPFTQVVDVTPNSPLSGSAAETWTLKVDGLTATFTSDATPTLAEVCTGVAAAINAVMVEVKRLDKGAENKHGNYKFTSVDDFLDATRPACAAAGLIIVPDEESVDMVEKWLRVKFSFTVAHASGETWDHSPTRTVMVNSAMGSQAYGAAQSYALKQFLRALFQISTGDGEDADTQPNEQLPSSQRRGPPPAPAPAPANPTPAPGGSNLPNFQ
jgi:hypothetical protein